TRSRRRATAAAPRSTVFRSLRFRLPAVFLAGIAVAGVVSAAIALLLLQDYTRNQTLSELKREAIGLTELYVQQAIKSSDEGRSAPEFAPAQLEKATGDRLYYAGVTIFPGQALGFRRLSRDQVDWPALQAGKVITFEFTPPDVDRRFLAVGHPLRFEQHGPTFGALIVAKPSTELRHTWFTLMKFVGLSLLGGLLVAGALAAYLSRRITKPVLGLSKAA